MKNNQKLILISFLLALLAAVAVFSYLNSLNKPKQKISETTILVAKKTIPPRTLIEKNMIEEMKVNSDSIYSNYLTDSSKIIGKYTKETILAKEGFRSEKIITNESEDIATKIGEDKRAIALNLSLEAGVAKLIKPGDSVDLIVFLGEKTENQVIVRPDISKLLLEDIEVVAIDQDSLRNETSSKDKKIESNFVVTLAVPTNDLEKIVLSEKIGSITLALRPLKSKNTEETNGTVWQELISSNEETKKNECYIYTVKKGDTLRTISKAFYGDTEKFNLIMKENNIKDENHIEPGIALKILKIAQ